MNQLYIIHKLYGGSLGQERGFSVEKAEAWIPVPRVFSSHESGAPAIIAGIVTPHAPGREKAFPSAGSVAANFHVKIFDERRAQRCYDGGKLVGGGTKRRKVLFIFLPVLLVSCFFFSSFFSFAFVPFACSFLTSCVEHSAVLLQLTRICTEHLAAATRILILLVEKKSVGVCTFHRCVSSELLCTVDHRSRLREDKRPQLQGPIGQSEPSPKRFQMLTTVRTRAAHNRCRR
jgi:hypothetical protein